ncbi:MAG: hypothetical protein AB7H77_03955 [Bdellovibrionales bacterium]
MSNPLDQKRAGGGKVPAWLMTLQSAGYLPYISTSRRLLPFLDTSPFGEKANIFLMENDEHGPFHEAYLLSNSLSFKSPDLKMPHWVLIDCALMQTAIVGFMKACKDLPESLLSHYRNDPGIDLDRLDFIPVSGQISSPSVGGESFVGISLFSLAKSIPEGPSQLGLYTKALALEVYRAARQSHYYGIAQYNNPSLKIHGRFTPRLEIHQPMVPLHPGKDMTLIYKMTVDFDPHRLDEPPSEAGEPTFWLNARDISGKNRMQAGIADGKRYVIMPPFSVKRSGEIFLPIKEEKAE